MMAGSDQAAYHPMPLICNTSTDPKVHSCAQLCGFLVWQPAASDGTACHTAVPALPACQNRSALPAASGNYAKANCTATSSKARVRGENTHSTANKHVWHRKPQAAPTGFVPRRDNQQRSATETCHRSSTHSPVCLPSGKFGRPRAHTVCLPIPQLVHRSIDHQFRKPLQPPTNRA